MNDEEFMNLAIQRAREGIEAGQVPVGAALAFKTKLLDSAPRMTDRLWH